MMTEKMRVSASSVISSVADTSATPARCRPMREGMRESVPFALMTPIHADTAEHAEPNPLHDFRECCVGRRGPWM